ncbi:cysteine desulfurase family protein [Pedobacter sp.]|uniref:cysteine desulfurase family protein n=1 Tax=Pedobacter sp. TaxID=1411316 RepID=UPI0031DBB2BA
MKKYIYLDNAATTALDAEVLSAMLPYLTEHYGNPSSSYALGREAKAAIEANRKSVALALGVSPLNIYFTSGGTESNNTAIACAVNELGCKHIITSSIEHHAVLNTVKRYCERSAIDCTILTPSTQGFLNLQELEDKLIEKNREGIKCLVSLMHANNEIGVLLDIEKVGNLCEKYDAIFHSDCVQTIGHLEMDLKKYKLHFASASGHKFHGPKGTGILYASERVKLSPLIIGGGQERQSRAGTENVAGIVGFGKALELSMRNHPEESTYIRSLNELMRNALSQSIPDVSFNSPIDGLYTVLSVNFPNAMPGSLLLAHLDRAGICASGGSACSSGSDGGSHVINALGLSSSGSTVRFSFSKLTSATDVDEAVRALSAIFQSTVPVA